MKLTSKDELLRDTIRENSALRSKLARAESNIDFVAMMTGVDIETAESSPEEVREDE